MTTTVHIYGHGLDERVSFWEGSEGAKAIRFFNFNLSGEPDVAILKSLAAAFIEKAKQIQQARPETAREMAVAITNMQLWGVLGVTTPRPE